MKETKSPEVCMPVSTSMCTRLWICLSSDIFRYSIVITSNISVFYEANPSGQQATK